jgi:hypothetical protein
MSGRAAEQGEKGNITLREFLEARLDRLEQKVDIFTGLLPRVIKLESAVLILKWVGGLVTAVVIALVIAYLKRALGL